MSRTAPLRQRLVEALRTKFAVDSIYNIASVGLLAASGLALNFIIAGRYGAQTLGAFNIVCSIYVVVSQLATLGLQASSLKHAAEFCSDKDNLSAMTVSALTLTGLAATLVCAALYLASETIGRIYGSEAVAVGIRWLLPGLWCFAVNKLLLGVVNGLRHMKAYAVFSCVRSLILLGGVVFCAAAGVAGERLTGIISAGEMVLLVCLLVYAARHIGLTRFSGTGEWLRRHLAFGLKSLPMGIMSEAGYRLDVLLLGYFAGEYQVGIYSFAAMLVEGFNQLPFVFRRNVDPILTRLIVSGQIDELRAMIRRGKRLGFIGMSLVGATLVGVFPLVVTWVIGKPAFLEGWPVFAVLMTGAVILAVYLPFGGILVQAGYPGYQTILTLGMLSVNLTLGVTFIPFFAAKGAAAATAMAYVSYVVFLKILSRRILGVAV